MSMDKVAFYKNQIEKIALNKAQKFFNAGKLSEEAIKRLFEEKSIINNINNRINARAKRMAEGVFPKKMDLRKFFNVSQPDNLKERAAIDTRRVMKHQGHDNSKVISELKRQAEYGADINHVGDRALNGRTRFNFSSETGDIGKFNIEIPKKDAEMVPDSYEIKPSSRKILKELRALTARHEISGEATANSRMLRALKHTGYNTNSSNLKKFMVNDHATPEVLWDDATMARRLSPETQKITEEQHKHNITEVVNPNIRPDGSNINESELMHRLRIPYERGNDISPEKAKAIINTPYFKTPAPTKQEIKDSFKNIGRLNGIKGEASGAVADEYMKTPFFYTRTKK
jgi:hypothetical protein